MANSRIDLPTRWAFLAFADVAANVDRKAASRENFSADIVVLVFDTDIGTKTVIVDGDVFCLDIAFD